MQTPPISPDVLGGIVEAVHDRDEHVLRRLLAQLAEQATIADLYALCDALSHLRLPDGPPPACAPNP